MPTSARGSRRRPRRNASASVYVFLPAVMLMNGDIVSSRGRSGVARTRGFTLLEMMVVLVIAGLLVSLASISFTRNPHTDLTSRRSGLPCCSNRRPDEAQVAPARSLGSPSRAAIGSTCLPRRLASAAARRLVATMVDGRAA